MTQLEITLLGAFQVSKGGKRVTRLAKANLRKSLSTLRQLFDNALIITRQTVAFNRESAFWLDVEAFESALAEDGPASEKLDPLREAVGLCPGLAGVASSVELAERAAMLLGMVQAAPEASNVPLPLGPADQAAYDRYLAATKAQLDPQVLAAAWEEGERMTLSQAVACALELALENPPNP